MRNITSSTGTELLSAYIGEHGSLVVKKSQMVITISKNLEEELSKTFKIMDEFAYQVQRMEEITNIKIA